MQTGSCELTLRGAMACATIVPPSGLSAFTGALSAAQAAAAAHPGRRCRLLQSPPAAASLHFAGRVRVGGLDTREHKPDAIAAVAGTLLQDPETQIVMSTVAAELAFPLENRGHSSAAVARRTVSAPKYPASRTENCSSRWNASATCRTTCAPPAAPRRGERV